MDERFGLNFLGILLLIIHFNSTLADSLIQHLQNEDETNNPQSILLQQDQGIKLPLSKRAECQYEINNHCSGIGLDLANDLIILGCLVGIESKDAQTVSQSCSTLIHEYKLNLMENSNIEYCAQTNHQSEILSNNKHEKTRYTASTHKECGSSSTMATKERTFIAIKPDAVQRGIIGEVIKRFERRGYKLVAMKMIHAGRPLLEVHYQELREKAFFSDLVTYMSSGPLVAMVWEGLDVVKQGRLMLGATNPLASNPGTIRGDFSIQTGRNIVHGSDSLESAKREIALWFKPEEICDWTTANVNWVYE